MKNRRAPIEASPIFGANEGICAFSGAPHSAIINCRLCRQVYRKLSFVRQSVLLPQNGFHPQIPSLLGTHTNKKDTPARVSFLLSVTNDSAANRFSLLPWTQREEGPKGKIRCKAKYGTVPFFISNFKIAKHKNKHYHNGRASMMHHS